MLKEEFSKSIKEPDRVEVREVLPELISLLGPAARQDELVKIADGWIARWAQEDSQLATEQRFRGKQSTDKH